MRRVGRLFRIFVIAPFDGIYTLLAGKKPAHSTTNNLSVTATTMHASFFSFLLVAVQVVGGSEESELFGLIEVIAAQNAELETTIDQLRVDIAQLQQNYGALVASTAARHDKVSKWHQGWLVDSACGLPCQRSGVASPETLVTTRLVHNFW